MHVRSSIAWALLALFLAAGSASAQHRQLVPTSEFYFDEDTRTSRPIVAIKGEGEELVNKLLNVISRNARAREETAQLAHVAMAGGRPELGRELYSRVLSRMDASDGLYRSVLWNYGWDLYRLDDFDGALEQWETLFRSRNVTAQWMPTTFALLLWQLDRRDEAVQWYAAAVRSEPARWRGTDQYEVLLPDWREQDRATLAEVQQAWQANPPEWR